MEQYVFFTVREYVLSLSLRPVYEAAGRWPEDGIVVDYVVYKVFAADAAPADEAGRRCGKMPVWVPVSEEVTET
ncbi:phage tail protein [Escherichia coli]|uniref:phage tail protein n=1 Tax=Escherichia coli TaxID=562 RepID=UPI0022386EB8|nr:phage tail protein [Escherichia coli]MCW7275404.1 phage tail protein [Escherichia coli]